MTFGADNCFSMASFPGLWTVSNSSMCAVLVGVPVIDPVDGRSLDVRHVGFHKRGGLIDGAGFEFDPNCLEPTAGLCELHQQPLKTTLVDAAWGILYP